MVSLMLVTVLVVLILAVTSIAMTARFFTKQMALEKADHLSQRQAWEVERERLLNRCMTKEWESYTQMAGALQAVSSSSDGPPPDGLSDETEARRWAEANGISIGEVLLDEHDIVGLGLNG